MKPRLIDVFECKGVQATGKGERRTFDIDVEVMSGTPYTLRFDAEELCAISVLVIRHFHSVEGGFKRGIGVVDPDDDEGAGVAKGMPSRATH